MSVFLGMDGRHFYTTVELCDYQTAHLYKSKIYIFFNVDNEFFLIWLVNHCDSHCSELNNAFCKAEMKDGWACEGGT